MDDETRVAEIQKDARSLIYVSDGSSGSDKVGRLIESVPWLLDRLHAAEARIECARCGEKMIRQDANNTPSNTAMEVCSRCCFQIFDGLTKAAEAGAAEAEAVIGFLDSLLDGIARASGDPAIDHKPLKVDEVQRVVTRYLNAAGGDFVKRTDDPRAERVADFVDAADDWLARVKAEAWDEGYGLDEECGMPRANPYRAGADHE